MRRLLSIAVAFTLVLLMSGCSAAAQRNDWVREQGGLDAPSAQLTGLAAELCAAAHLPPVKVHVLASDQTYAFSWSDGEIYVCRGMQLRATDEQLAAALAHELGHIVNDRTTRDRKAALAGRDEEVAADATAVAILHAAGRDVESLPSVLALVARHESCPATRATLARRIAILNGHP